VHGCTNKNKKVPFILAPTTATIQAKTTYDVKIIFQPDHVDNNYFDVLLIDVPN
jgi:P pilus assembly chaperone PapD